MDRVTLQTIASQAGVSRQTVSNAFNRPDQLSEQLRREILDLADRMGYRGPDPLARALSTGRTNVVGVALTERTTDALADPAAREFLIGVAEALEAVGCNLLLVSGRPEDPTVQSPVATAAVDAMIAYSLSPSDERISSIRATGIPMVTVDQPRLDSVPHIGADQERLGRLAADHLAGLGHTHIGVLAVRVHRDGRGGPVTEERWRDAEFPLTVQRWTGIIGASLDVEVVWECPEPDDVSVAVDAMLADSQLSAILAMSDRMAIAALTHLRDRGVDVPGQMSIVGIDDNTSAGDHGLTTVRQDHRAKGREAVRRLEPGSAALDTSITAELVIRSTTGPR